MSCKFNSFQVTLEKQESQRMDTCEQSTKRQGKRCSTGSSETIQREDDLDRSGGHLGKSGEMQYGHHQEA